MALHFVATSILTSEDGIDFSKETPIENEEVRLARLTAERASSKPLFAQLAEQREKQQEEYDNNTKKIFAPPKALDDEDVAFFNELDDKKTKALGARAERDSQAVEEFRIACRSKGEAPPVKFASVKPKSTEAHSAPLRAINATKRKSGPQVDASKKGGDIAKADLEDKSKRPKTTVSTASQHPTPKSSPRLTSLLGNYGSDSENDDD